MGTPKHLLKFPNDDTNTPMYVHLIRRLHVACGFTRDVFISLGGEGEAGHDLESRIKTPAAAETQSNEGADEELINVHIIYDCEGQNTAEGPAAGLLAAYRSDSTAHWLVLPCDFPFITSEALEMLRREYQGPVTCFENEEGFCEPLLGIWGPEALKRLEENVGKGRLGPKFTVRDLGGKMIKPENWKWLVSVNTPDEWEAAIASNGALAN